MKHYSVTLIAFMLISFIAKSQEFEVPKDFNPKTKEDYVATEKDVIACADWLENSPLDQAESKRIEANAFLMKWLTGSPTVTVSLDADILLKSTDKNPHLLMIFLGGWTRYSLQNNYSKDVHKGYYEGFKSVITVAKKGVGLKKDKDLDKMVEIYDKGELEKWVQENIKAK
jgi:hypothetical protein